MEQYYRHFKSNIVTFIHSILKAALRKELDYVLALRCSYNVGAPVVTVISIK